MTSRSLVIGAKPAPSPEEPTQPPSTVMPSSGFVRSPISICSGVNGDGTRVPFSGVRPTTSAVAIIGLRARIS